MDLVGHRFQPGDTYPQVIRVYRPENVRRVLTVGAYRPHLLLWGFLTDGVFTLNVYNNDTNELLATAERDYTSLNESKELEYTHGYFYMDFPQPGLNLNFRPDVPHIDLRLEFSFPGYTGGPAWVGICKEFENRLHGTYENPPNASVSPLAIEELTYKEL